jgi:glycosyltransferase involved in cell wall biosynthesis
MKIYYIANARMPTEKAHGIQIAKMAEAFIEAGVDIVLVVPKRSTVNTTIQAFYGLRIHIKVVTLPALDLYTKGRIGYFLSSLSFMISYSLYIFWKRIKREKMTLYTVDLDNFSSSALALLGVPYFSEMHGAKPATFSTRLLFRHASGIISINSIIKKELSQTFSLAEHLVIVEPNGVDSAQFSNKYDKKQAREILSLPPDVKIALYSGKFFAWKGLGIFLEAAKQLKPDILIYFVGGTKEEFIEVTKADPASIPQHFIFVGQKPYSEMNAWIAAADVLVVLGTKQDTQSFYYTSPMKLFEYLTSHRPIVASRTPAIKEIVSDDEVIFYEPDNAHDLAEKITYSIAIPDLKAKTESAYRKSEGFTWQARGKRIKEFISKRLNDNGHKI